MKKENGIFALLVSAIAFLTGVEPAAAHCPVCTVAVGSGVAVAKWYGVDLIIVGLWVGAFIISTALWSVQFLEEREWMAESRWKEAGISAGVFLSFAVPFYFSGLIGNPAQTVFGIDKLLLGMVAGSVLSYFSPEISGRLKNKNNGNVYVPFQGVLIALTLLTSSSFFLWWYL